MVSQLKRNLTWGLIPLAGDPLTVPKSIHKKYPKHYRMLGSAGMRGLDDAVTDKKRYKTAIIPDVVGAGAKYGPLGYLADKVRSKKSKGKLGFALGLFGGMGTSAITSHIKYKAGQKIGKELKKKAK